MMMNDARYFLVFGLVAIALLSLALACGTETVEVPVEKVVTQEVVKEVMVPGETVVVEKEVVKTVEVPGETVVVEKEVVKTVEVPGDTVVVEKEVMVEVERDNLPPLIVGNLNAFTGSIAEFGPPLRNSVQLAASHVNRAGGVGGGSMLVISRDTAVNPVQGVDAARALVDVEGAVAIVGALSSGVTIASAQSVTIPKGVLLISGASTAPAITTLEDDDLLFRTTPSDAAQGAVLARLADELGYQTVGIMYINNAYGEGLAAQFEESFAEYGGQVTAKVPHEDTQPTFASELEKATEGNPDALAVMSYTGQSRVYVREALEGGYADTFLFVDGVKGSEWIDEIDAWDELDGTLGTAPGSEGNPALSIFETAYEETYGFPVTHPFMAEHYDATVLIALAAAKAGSTTDSAAIRDALRFVANAPGEVVGPGRDGISRALRLIAEGKDVNYEGAGGIVDFDENGDVFGTIEIWQVKDGEIQSTGRFELP
ncbi:MAG: ABC transporter substrate-binding protein [Dehalococcoidia bacterium]|nr:ABC transporter substrate-binding protein [Dehalococcoidia bacterium]